MSGMEKSAWLSSGPVPLGARSRWLSPAAARRSEHRGQPRLELGLKAWFRADRKSAFARTVATSITSQGLALDSNSPLRVGTEVYLQLRLPDGELLSLWGEVAWTGANRIGVRLQGTETIGHRRLGHWYGSELARLASGRLSA